MENIYTVKKCISKSDICVSVPGSKSITNRALMLAALQRGECVINGALFSDDSRAFIDCLIKLGFSVSADEENSRVIVKGEGGNIPNRNAEINVRSAGTAARFLTVMLSFAGGEYVLNSSEQMKKRPMGELIMALREVGVKIECLEEGLHFPFKIISDGVKADKITINTDVSSQFASAILMSAPILKNGLKIITTGGRTSGAYINITKEVMRSFSVPFTQSGAEYFVPNSSFHIDSYSVEPDFSAASYFYAAGAVLGRKTRVNGASLNSIQGDKKFLSVLEKMGCTVKEENGAAVLYSDGNLNGVEVDMNDFSDQALTLAAIAPFARGVTKIKNIGHIRAQECDRINAITKNLSLLGVKCISDEDSVTIWGGKITPATLPTYNDHRVAMSFALTGLKDGGVNIENPSCTKKTFENYFSVFEELYK